MSITPILTTILTQLSLISPVITNPQTSNVETQQQQSYNPFSTISTTTTTTDSIQLKNLLLTLHCIFPNDLLLALDLLDRGLVRRFTYLARSASAIASDAQTSRSIRPSKSKSTSRRDEDAAAARDGDGGDRSVFIVQSTTATTASRAGSGAGETGTDDLSKAYQVHLKAWNCSCPAFVMGSFSSTLSSSLSSSLSTGYMNDEVDESDESQNGCDYESWFGGTLRRRQISTDECVEPPFCKHILACVLVAKCPGLFGMKCSVVEVDDSLSLGEVAGWCAS